jgi:broad specificity phosphatase PhoE
MSVSLALSVESTPGLGPWDVGEFAGKPVSEVKDELQSYMNGRSTEKVPGGESFRTFLQRWKKELLRLLTLMRKLDRPIVAVTHARNLYSLENLLFGEEIPVKGPPHPSAVVRLAGDPGAVTMMTICPGEAQEGFSG